MVIHTRGLFWLMVLAMTGIHILPAPCIAGVQGNRGGTVPAGEITPGELVSDREPESRPLLTQARVLTAANVCPGLREDPSRLQLPLKGLHAVPLGT